jgi:hypothetical protein
LKQKRHDRIQLVPRYTALPLDEQQLHAVSTTQSVFCFPNIAYKSAYVKRTFSAEKLFGDTSRFSSCNLTPLPSYVILILNVLFLDSLLVRSYCKRCRTGSPW